MALALTKKFLQQEITSGASQDVYASYLANSVSGRIFVPIGQGIEATYANQLKGEAFNENYVPGSSDFTNSKMENFIFSDYVLLPDSQTATNHGIYKIALDESDWLYPEYFLTGKLAEQYAVVKSKLEPTMLKYEFALVIAKQQAIITALKAQTATTWSTAPAGCPATSYVKDTYATEQITAITDLEYLLSRMCEDNTTFAAGKVVDSSGNPTISNTAMPSGKYVNCNYEDLTIICNARTKSVILDNLSRWSVRDKTRFVSVIDKFKEIPTQYIHPTSGTLTSLTGMLTDGQLFIVEKKYMPVIYNFSENHSQFYTENVTTRFLKFLRESVGIYSFCSVALFECAALLKPVEITGTSDSNPVYTSEV